MSHSDKPSGSPLGHPKKTPKPQVEPFDWKNLCAPHPVIGVDEVGRGCLAGPVYAAAVILPEDCPYLSSLTDSKLLSEARREELSGLLWESARVGVGIASVEEIDAINILQAARLAMARAVSELQLNEGHILVDGRDPVPGGFQSWPQTTLVKGDLRAAPVAAASIVAKVARDRWMKELALKEPGYGFEIHKGYGTPAHRQAIQERGPSRFHRRTFAGVREHWHRLEACTAPGSLV